MGVRRAYRVPTPYNGVELSEVNYEQTTDTLYLAHLNHAPAKFERADHDDWSFSALTFGPDIAVPTGVGITVTNPNVDAVNSGDNYNPQPATYVVTAVNDDTGQESRASAEVTGSNDLTLKRNYNTISWTAVTGATRYNVYKADNTQFFGYIGTTDSVSFRDVNVGPNYDRSPPQAENPFDSAGNYPSTVTLFEQRLIWARTQNVPNGVWGSRIGVTQLENMDRARPALADDAFSMAIVAAKSNPVNALLSSSSLIALTSNGIYVLDGDGQGGVIEANSAPQARRQIGRGSSRLRPILIDNTGFYSPTIGYSVRAIGYSFELDGIKSNDMTIFSPHFFEGFRIVEWDYASEPRSIIWAVRDDGKLLAFTWEQEQNVWGWTLCETDGLVKSLCVVTEQGEDRVYLIVERTYNGVTRTFVERMASYFWDDVADSCYMDCAVSGTFDTPQNSFSGLWHLDGRTDVVVNADGAFYEGLTVEDGTITLPHNITASKVTIGIPYQVDVKTLPVRLDLPNRGSNLGRRQQVGEIVLQLENTSNILAGIDEDHLFDVKQNVDSYGEPRRLMNGVTEPITMDNKAGTEAEVHIRQTLPAPFKLLGIGVDPLFDE